MPRNEKNLDRYASYSGPTMDREEVRMFLRTYLPDAHPCAPFQITESSGPSMREPILHVRRQNGNTASMFLRDVLAAALEDTGTQKQPAVDVRQVEQTIEEVERQIGRFRDDISNLEGEHYDAVDKVREALSAVDALEDSVAFCSYFGSLENTLEDLKHAVEQIDEE